MVVRAWLSGLHNRVLLANLFLRYWSRDVANKKFRYQINVRKLKPEISSDLHYAATVGDLRMTVRGQPDKPVVHDFGETCARTKKEAEKKMRRQVKSWISNYA